MTVCSCCVTCSASNSNITTRKQKVSSHANHTDAVANMRCFFFLTALLAVVVFSSREPLCRPCWRDKRCSLPPSELWLTCSLIYSQRGTDDGPGCVRERRGGGRAPADVISTTKSIAGEQATGWLWRHSARSWMVLALDSLGCDYKLGADIRESWVFLHEYNLVREMGRMKTKKRKETGNKPLRCIA